jgi:meso-butanediol dehydrogenase/(S,S)-butanediol dehydrogenase/diacetyl reductase
VARFDGKVAFITGAASGMGRAITLRLASEGAQVFAFDLNAAGLAETAAAVHDGGGTVATRAGDVSSRAECHAAIAEAVRIFGKLDVLGNVAGVSWAERVADITEEGYRKMMGVNVDGYLWMAQAAIPHLLESGGNIVSIASNAGLMGQAYTVVYCMTKAAVVNMTKSLAMEFVKENLRVNAIAPGGIETALTHGFRIPSDIDFALMAPYTGFRKMGKPDDIANLFAFVASDEARNIHGAILSSDGGVTAG